MSVLQTLARRGARLVIDDFGMGYAALSYLTLTGAIKLDRALVNRLPYDKATIRVVSSLLTLAADLDIEVGAEGVETSAQNAYLANAGCLHAQGFGYAKPMDISALRDFIAQNSAARAQLRSRGFSIAVNQCESGYRFCFFPGESRKYVSIQGTDGAARRYSA